MPSKFDLERRKKHMVSAMYNTKSKQYRDIQNAKKPDNMPEIQTGQLLAYMEGKWVNTGTYCLKCGTMMGLDKHLIDNHKYICKEINNNTESRPRGRPKKTKE